MIGRQGQQDRHHYDQQACSKRRSKKRHERSVVPPEYRGRDQRADETHNSISHNAQYGTRFEERAGGLSLSAPPARSAR